MNNSSLVPVAVDGGNALAYAFTAVNVAGLLLNSLALVAAARPHVVPGRVPRLYLVNQLVGDWVCCFFQAFSLLIDRQREVADSGWGTLVCRLMYNRAVYYSVLHATASNIVLLTVERYVSVVHPLQHDKLTPALNAFAIFLSWSTGVVRAIYRYLEPARSGTSCIVVPMDTRVFAPILVLWGVVMPIVVVASLNGRLVYVLKRQSKAVGVHSNGPTAVATAAVSLRAKLQRDLTSSVCITCLAYLVTATPLSTVYILMSYDVMKRDFRGSLYQVLVAISSSFFAINPAVCIFLMHSVRNEIGAMLTWRKRREASLQAGASHASATTNAVSLRAM